MPLGAEIENKIVLFWATDADREDARATLAEYGLAAYEREPDRVRLAILKLSEGSVERLREMTAAAKRDYRDVLMWAEYPEEGRTPWTLRQRLDDDERKELAKLRDRDRHQYEQWKKG
jgi:hypothetical protein